MGKGKLKFKGEKDAKKKKKKTKHEKHNAVNETEPTTSAADTALALHASLHPKPAKPVKQKPADATVIQTGIGLISSSGTVVYGHDTLFNSTLNAGDAILVDVPMDNGTAQEEMRILTMRLSDVSASLSSAFSNDLKNPTAFKYITKPRDQRKERMAKEKNEKLTKDETERSAFGTYGGGGKEFVYREKTEHGGYRIRKDKIEDDADRSDLLIMRTQKKSDKFC